MERSSRETATVLARTFVLTALVVLSLLFAGCGSSTTTSGNDTISVSPAITSTSATSADSTSEPQQTTEIITSVLSPDLTKLVAAWKAKGIQIIGVGAKPDDASHIIVKVLQATIAGPDGIFADHQLERQAVLLALYEKLPLKLFDIVTVDSQGKEESLDRSIRLSDTVEQKVWSKPALMDEATLKEKLLALVKDAAAQTGVGSTSSILTAPQDGRTLDLTATLTKNSADQLNGFLESVVPGVEELNRQGGHLAVLNLKVNDSTGNPALRSVQDFQLGSTTDWWSGQKYMPYWANEPPSPTKIP